MLSMVNKSWIVRRGIAYGLLCRASGVSGVVMLFVIEALLQKYGYPATLRAIVTALFALTSYGALDSTTKRLVASYGAGCLK